MSITSTEQRTAEKTQQALDYYASERFQNPTSRRDLYISLLLWHLRVQFVRHLKRVLDVVLVLLGLMMLLPVMFIAALAIKLDSPGPAIFKQTRVGKWGETFTCYKFRSMCMDAEKLKTRLEDQNEVNGPIFKMRRDPRITRVGRVIRKLSIDELPQLFNVLKGDMSIVGPRPPLPKEVNIYELEYLRRLDAIPGITGLPQISGRSNLDFDRWVELDLEYIARQSVRQDLVILIKTIPAVIFGRGAY